MDFHEVYGFDFESGERRTWRWFRTRVAGLLDRPPIVSPDGVAVPTTRLGWIFNPPKKE